MGTPAAEPAELRILDGPNLYFSRPAIKLTLAVPGWHEAGQAAVVRYASGLGIRVEPGRPKGEQRLRVVAKISANLTRRLAAEAGVQRLAVRSHVGPDPGTVVVAFPWRRRGSARALAEASARAMALGPARAPARVVAELAPAIAAADPGPEPSLPDPVVQVIQITGTNGKTTTTRLLAHIVMAADRRVAYSSTDGVYRGDRRIRKGDYSGFGGAAMALAQHPDIAVLETARGGLLLRGSGVAHNDVAVVTNVSADHLGLHGVRTVDQLAEVKSIITKITRPEGWDVLNADDPRVWSMRRSSTGRPWVFTLDHDNPAVRDALADGGRATTVIDGRIAWLEGHTIHPLIGLVDVPITLAGISSVYTSNALAAASAALAIGLPIRGVVRGLKTFVMDPEQNPGRANLFRLDGRIVVVDFAHNEAGIIGMTEILRGLRRPGSETWVAVCTAGDRTDDILHGFGFQAAHGTDHFAVADLRHYTRGRTAAEIYDRLAAAAADAGVRDVPRYAGELHALRSMMARSRPGDVLGVTALGMRPKLFRWLAGAGAERLSPADVRRLVRATGVQRSDAQRTHKTEAGRASSRSAGINVPQRSQRP